MIDMYMFPFWTCFPFDYVVFVHFIFFVDFTFVVWWFSFVLCFCSLLGFVNLLCVFDLWLLYFSDVLTHSKPLLQTGNHIGSNILLKIYILLLFSPIFYDFDALFHAFMFILLLVIVVIVTFFHSIFLICVVAYLSHLLFSCDFFPPTDSSFFSI